MADKGKVVATDIEEEANDFLDLLKLLETQDEDEEEADDFQDLLELFET